MRIISGYLGGRQFDAPKGPKTHPMSDRARGALFNILGDIDNLSVLDPFAGSGALSFEAISRGAANVIAVEQDRSAQQAVSENIRQLGLEDKVKLVNANAGSWLQTNPHTQFDLVLCDPPYSDPQPNLIKRLSKIVKPGGLLVLSWPASLALPELEDLDVLDHRQYANLTLAFFRQKG